MSEPLIINEFYFTTKTFTLDIKDYLVRITPDATSLSGPDVKLLQCGDEWKNVYLSHEILRNKELDENNTVQNNDYERIESIRCWSNEVITGNNITHIEIPAATHWHYGSLDIFSTIMQHVTHISRISCEDPHTDCIMNFPDFKLFMLWVISTNKILLERHTGKDVTALFSEVLKQCQN